MSFKLPMPASPCGGGMEYLYVHIFICQYVQITFVQVRRDRRSRCQRQSYTSPPGIIPYPPWSRPPAKGALGALLFRWRESGIYCRRREALGEGVLLRQVVIALTPDRSGATVATWTCAPLRNGAMRRPVAAGDICATAASACPCHASAPPRGTECRRRWAPPAPRLSRPALGLPVPRRFGYPAPRGPGPRRLLPL